MGHPDKLLKALFGTACVGFTVLIALLIAPSVSAPAAVSDGIKAVIATATIALYIALLVLWIYWLRYFWRTSQSGQFWLCLLVPYFYAAYKTAKYLRAPTPGGA